MNQLELSRRLSRLEYVCTKQNELLLNLGLNFAYFYENENKKHLAVIGRCNNGTADLTVIDPGVSGGVEMKYERQCWVYNGAKEDYENPKEGKWIPVVDPDEILELSIKQKEDANVSDGGTTES